MPKPTPESPAPARDRNLLFGVIAVQLHFITPVDLAKAAAVWATDMERDLHSVLVELGLLGEDKAKVIKDLLALQIKEHQGDASATLKSFGGRRAVEESFAASLAPSGPEVQASLQSFGGGVKDISVKQGPVGITRLDDMERVTLENPGRYTIKGEAGRGAMGQVLIAFDEHIGREVAVKELLPGPGGSSRPSFDQSPRRLSAESVTRFLREARITGQLEHPGIIPVHEIARRADGTIYYTMKLVRGKTLMERLKKCSSLSERLHLLPHFLDLCQSMAYSHSRGVVHRDLKPGNVMVGEFGETVVLDWGLAKVRGLADVRSEQLEENLRLIKQAAGDTVAGKPIGTPAYMSPEQAEGDIPNIDERSDVWSLGAMLYEILTGATPFPGNTAFEVMGMVIKDPVKKVCEVTKEAPTELCAVAEKCLSKDRASRYAHAGEVAADVEAFSSGGLVSAYEYSMAALAGRWVRKHWPLVTTVSIALALLIVLGVFAFLRIREERNRALDQRALAVKREQEAKTNLGEAYYQIGMRAEKQKLWNDALLYYTSALALNDREEERSGYYTASLRPWRVKLERTIGGLEARSFSLSFSPDGKLLVSGDCARRESGSCVKGRLELWNADTGKLFKTLTGHDNRVTSAVFSPDGKYLLSASWDNTVKLWSVESGECLQTMAGHQGPVYGVAFSPDGKLAASASHDGTIKVWSIPAGGLLQSFDAKGFIVSSVTFPPDGKHLLSGGGEGALQLWSLEGKGQQGNFPGHSSLIFTVAASPDGKTAVTASYDKTIKLWSIPSGECIRTLSGHEDAVTMAAFSPDGKTILSASLDKTMKLWSVETGECLLTISGHTDPVWSADFSPSGDRIASGSSDQTIKVWSFAKGQEVPSFSAAQSMLWAMAVSPDGKHLAAAASDDKLSCAVKLWPLPGADPVRVVNRRNYPRLCLAFSGDGKRLAVGGCHEAKGFECSAGEIVVWDVQSGSSLREITGHGAAVNAIAYSRDGGLAASGACGKSDDKRGCVQGEIKVWSAEDGQCLLTISQHQNTISSLAFTPDGKYLLSADLSEPAFRLWSLPGGELVRSFTGHQSMVSALAVAPDGKSVASVSGDGTIKLWDVATGKCLQTFKGHDVGVLSAAFDPEGRLLASGGWDHNIKLWSLQSGKCILTLRGHNSPVNSVAFTPDKSILGSASYDGVIKLWPMQWKILDEAPEELLKLAHQETGLTLDGFKTVPWSAPP